MAEADKRERRSHYRGKPRPGRRVEVGYVTPTGHHTAFTRNIGIGGAFIETTTPEKPGTALTLAVVVPNMHEPLEIRAEGRWTSPPPGTGDAPAGMGVKFPAPEGDELPPLDEYFAPLTGPA